MQLIKFTTGIYSHFAQQQVKQFLREAQNSRSHFDLAVERSFLRCKLSQSQKTEFEATTPVLEDE